MNDIPRISIITATYNRSAVLAFSIESVLRQTESDWEMIVVGDACTDDSAEVVARYRDPRLRFCNLEQNTGEQSGPNNTGVSQARAPVLAFLNHDDLYFPDHLELNLLAADQFPGYPRQTSCSASHPSEEANPGGGRKSG